MGVIPKVFGEMSSLGNFAKQALSVDVSKARNATRMMNAMENTGVSKSVAADVINQAKQRDGIMHPGVVGAAAYRYSSSAATGGWNKNLIKKDAKRVGIAAGAAGGLYAASNILGGD